MTVALIMGPTASGKSALALALAQRLGGEIVNADSLQVYRDLRILTARPTHEEEKQSPHRLYGHVDAGAQYSTGHWLSEALGAIADIQARGRWPILVGGAGLYFMALTKGLADIPPGDPELRAQLRARVDKDGARALHAELAEGDPVTAARLAPNDAPRILRALEVLKTTGKTITALQAKTKPALAPRQWRAVALTPERGKLYASIETRFDKMLADGALDEVRAFAARNLDPASPAMRAHGAPALMAHLRGELSLAQAREIAKRDTRHYAKRQFTWIANQMPDWPRISAPDLETRVTQTLAALGRSS